MMAQNTTPMRWGARTHCGVSSRAGVRRAIGTNFLLSANPEFWHSDPDRRFEPNADKLSFEIQAKA